MELKTAPASDRYFGPARLLLQPREPGAALPIAAKGGHTVAHKVKVRLEFELTQDQTKVLQQILARERVTASEACRLLLAHYVDAYRNESAMGIQRRLPRPPIPTRR
jgi:hypothetical protein